MKTAILLFIKSKNPPVFMTPLEIYYSEEPKIGLPFLFTRGGFTCCNLSEVKKITKFDGFRVLRTRNSYYALLETKSE